MRKPIVAGNWKMYKLLDEAVETALALKPLVANVNYCDIIIAPPFTALKTLADRLEGTNIKLAAQNCASEIKHGAQTGEIAADMLRDVGARYVIIGHSERRHLYQETDEMINHKIHAALSAELNVIFCIGETLSERDSGLAREVVAMQLLSGGRNLTTADMNRIIVAYEPVWAIGTGVTATPEQAQEMHSFIREVLAKQHSFEIAEGTRILYGGSVKPENIRSLMMQEDIDGALVGGASLQAEIFAQIVNFQN